MKITYLQMCAVQDARRELNVALRAGAYDAVQKVHVKWIVRRLDNLVTTLVDNDLCETMPPKKIVLVECGSCGCIHRADWHGECRNNSERFASLEDFSERMGISEFNSDGDQLIELL